MKALLFALAAAAGAAATMQTAANAALSARAGLGPALFLNTSVVLVGTIAIMVFTGGSLSGLPGAPLHHYLGGLCGIFILASLTPTLPRIGAATTVALVVLGQGLMALLVDGLGLWGVQVVPIGPKRMVGVALLVLGVLLLRR